MNECGQSESASELTRQWQTPFLVTAKDWLVADMPGRTARIQIQAPAVAKSWNPGQFLIIRKHEGSERIPITIAGGSTDTIEIVVQEVGKTTAELVQTEVGESLASVCGPLGVPSQMANYGLCVLLAGGYGSAAVLPIAKQLRQLGNEVVIILGARSRRLLILLDELDDASDSLQVATDDGSEGIKGNVLVPFQAIIDERVPNYALAIGPVPMMRAVVGLAEAYSIPTHVSLNPIMLDGTGMCGACRVRVDNEVQFACIDGPEFDGSLVDFDDLSARQGRYKDLERIAMESS